MTFSTGIIVVIVSMVFFYLRIALLRGRKKRYEREFAIKRRRVNGRLKGAALPQNTAGSPFFGITSWFLVAFSFILMIFGLLMYNEMTVLGFNLINNTPWIGTFTQYWYILVSLGVVIFAFCFKIDKPFIDD